MVPTEYIWKSFDGLDLYAVQMSPYNPVEVLVLFVHGHGDHSQRYVDWFSHLNERNIAVIAFDYRGNGKSQGKRGVIRKFDDLFQDVSLVFQNTKKLFPQIPVVLYGHSLGATMVLSYILRSKSLPKLAIATSPWLELKRHPGKLKSVMIRLANRIAPFATFESGLRSADFSTKDRLNVNDQKDLLAHNRISPRLVTEVEKEARWIYDNFDKLKVPLLVVQGLEDKVMNVSTVQNLVENLAGKAEYKEFLNVGHHLHLADNSKEVIDYIIDWIKKGIK